MKPDGKIQGVDVWVRENSYVGSGKWIIANGIDYPNSSRWLMENDKMRVYGSMRFWPSREAALAHLRQLEAKERPVIDLSTAKFGDKFKRDDGVIETYACLKEHSPGWHLMQSGQSFRTDGSWSEHSNPYRLVAPYTPPRTVEKWVSCWGGGTTSQTHASEEAARLCIESKREPFALVRITLTEGEGLAEPDVA